MLSTLRSPWGLAGQAELGTLGALYFNLAQGLKAKHEGKHEPLTHIAVSTAVGQHQEQPAARNAVPADAQRHREGCTAHVCHTARSDPPPPRGSDEQHYCLAPKAARSCRGQEPGFSASIKPGCPQPRCAARMELCPHSQVTQPLLAAGLGLCHPTCNHCNTMG